jgi:hypothetical protein
MAPTRAQSIGEPARPHALWHDADRRTIEHGYRP